MLANRLYRKRGLNGSKISGPRRMAVKMTAARLIVTSTNEHTSKKANQVWSQWMTCSLVVIVPSVLSEVYYCVNISVS